MVYFIRFFKLPKVYEDANHVPCVSAVITIQNDLGDLFLGTAVKVEARLVVNSNDDTDDASCCERQYQLWRAGDRSMSINMKSRKRHLALRLCVAAKPTDTKFTGTVPAIVPAGSATFGWGSQTPRQAEALLERRFEMPGEQSGVLKIWEQSGNSIACHIWDAALGFLLLFHKLHCQPESAQMPRLLHRLNSASHGEVSRRSLVIELGSGCGIVGIAMSKIWSLQNVLLTDQVEAEGILLRNIEVANPASNCVQYKPLVWENSGDIADINSADLVLISDCTYNPDSAPALVKTLAHIARVSPQVNVLVGMKRRHDSESIFFELMRKEGFVILEESIIMLPELSDDGQEHTSIEVYLFKNDDLINEII